MRRGTPKGRLKLYICLLLCTTVCLLAVCAFLFYNCESMLFYVVTNFKTHFACPEQLFRATEAIIAQKQCRELLLRMVYRGTSQNRIRSAIITSFVSLIKLLWWYIFFVNALQCNYVISKLMLLHKKRYTIIINFSCTGRP